MYLVIKSDKAERMETKLHQLGSCISDIVDMLHEGKHISRMPEDYSEHSRGGYAMRSMHEDHPMHEPRPGEYGYYAPTERYPRNEDINYARGRGRY